MRIRIKVNSNKYRVNNLYKDSVDKLVILAISIAEDLLKEIDNPHHERKFTNDKINYLNSRFNGELKYLICDAYHIIINRSVGYKPLLVIKNSDFQRKLVTIIPI